MSSMPKEILKKYATDFEFHNQVKGRLDDKMFSNGLLKAKHAVDDAYDKYKDKSLSLKEIAMNYIASNPSITISQKESILAEFDAIDRLEDINDDIAFDMVYKMSLQSFAQDVAQQSIQIMQGEHYDTSLVLRATDKLNKMADRNKEDDLKCSNDMEELFEEIDREHHYSFHVPSINDRVGGLSKGMFVVVGARPNVGKSGFAHSMIASPHGFLDQGAKCLMFTNEERPQRHMLRMISASCQERIKYVQEFKHRFIDKWKKKSETLQIIDSSSLTFGELEAIVEKEKPDVVVIDILDKTHIGGSYARDDQRLTSLYSEARDLAKRQDCVVFGMCQLSAEASGKIILNDSMLSGSRTGKAGEADLIVLIGKEDTEEGDTNMRWINIVKNKITGVHGNFAVIFDNLTATYME